MAHVHGAAASAAQTSKQIAHAGHNMAQVAKAAPAATSFHNVAKGAAAAGAVKVASKKAGKSFLGKVFSHPLVVFGLGVAVGYAIHKYRKEIIESANRAVEKSQDFVLQQRENLEDLVAEAPESAN